MPRPHVLVVDNGTLSLPQLSAVLDDLGTATTVVDTASVPPRLADHHQAVVLSGTKVRAHDLGHYARLLDLLANTDVPVLGICGGMQLLAVAAGGRLCSGPQRVGRSDVQVDTDEPLFTHIRSPVTLFQRHTLYLREAPQGFRVIGRSAQAPVEFLRSADGRFMGSQSHLEFRPHGREILRGFTDLLR
ncbi:gamma-glutamyl-gamma-aminobutyrate hydrolase family protein [Streptomyces sp. NPDC005562]|uniref:type 1 glutamine amidotransferase n=1 Tax=Streptomyces sp. NPDC005562 TaxID=3154890 RepID=UPI0033AE238F